MGLWIWPASIVGGGAVAWWIRRRFIAADSYFEREYRDPPISDIPDRLGGGGL